VVFAAPSFLGGKNQMPMAYSPETKLFYVPANEWGMEIWNEPVTYKKGAAYLGAGFTIKTLSEDGTSAHCAPSTRRPARSSGKRRTTRRCGAAC
jgi:alcohol dehydrogenase (cytochrome c)